MKNLNRSPNFIKIDLSKQLLHWSGAKGERKTYRVSTALNGPGEQQDSGKTPRGRHIIRAKIGAQLPLGAVLIGRRWRGEIYSHALAQQWPERDWILSRILWLSGLELGVNRLGHCDTFRRYIYIHGTPETEPLGVPRSHGCVRMHNADVIELFDRTNVGTEVCIYE